jgi:hypothetical protein
MSPVRLGKIWVKEDSQLENWRLALKNLCFKALRNLPSCFPAERKMIAARFKLKVVTCAVIKIRQ